MRVIWNLVSGEDNSGKPNIRSTYAMRNAIEFIEKLDSHDVYSSLEKLKDLKEQKIGNSEFDERCKEEIEKADKIKEDNNWEEKIIDAEKSLFFKGTIRFLFRDEDGKVDWSKFHEKSEQAKKYFDKNGIKEDPNKVKLNNNGIKEDPNKVKLTKALVLQCEKKEQIYEKQIFNPNASTWLWILSSKEYQKAVHNILTSEKLCEKCDNCKEFKIFEWKRQQEPTIEVILDLNNLPYEEMIEKIPQGRFRYNYDIQKLGYYEPYKRDAITFNEILSNLCNNCNNSKITAESRINNTTFFWGWDIDFTYEEKSFRWKSDNNVCLIDNEDKKFEVDDKINKDNFTQKLGELFRKR